ncbi:monovalent cation/H+ antiporter subunit E [Caenimonas sedimenti]|uniref:Monovalent cation/H+ antiporter subunit E n=1 Tax=Caenimonas sedimenti TaxID=2596921 RepID=A0A562ZJK1_9BURK|nr:Na+/H+ antiporter subunit E [Caenimonas sedimenti]TWO68516.1 monovalent cation/H+ antiporter subunit E [Caenimonas sedimenti]
MKRRPSLILALSLGVFWLVLNDSLAPADLLVALLVALVVPWLASPLKPPGGPMRKPLVLARLVLRVGGDVILSALQVARGALQPVSRPPSGMFIRVPLELRDSHALTALAVITTVVPGSLWSELAPDRSAVLLHVFGVDDEAAYVLEFKSRYERPLKEIFE